MAEKDLIYALKIKHKGVWNFKDTYQFLYRVIDDLGYFIIEKTYNEGVGGEGKTIEIEWLALRKISDYFRYNIAIRWFVTTLTDVEVTKGNEKIKTNKGALELTMKAYLEKDYESRFETHPLLKFLRGVYDKYIIRPRILAYEDKLVAETDEIAAQLKSYLALEGRK